MKTLFLTGFLLFCCLVVLFSAGPAAAIEPLPEETGFSGFVNLGGAYISAETNMVKGTELFDIGKGSIDSLSGGPESESDGSPVLNGELAYTFSETGTQLYAGNQLEDFLRFDFTTLLGVRQKLPDGSTGAVSGMLQPIVTEVWEDPYVTDAGRRSTDRESSGVRLEWDRPLGTNFGLLYQYRNVTIDDELSGTRGGLGLTPDEIRLLDREGGIHRADLLYVWSLGEGHALIPEVRYLNWDLDGDAMASEGAFFNLTYAFRGDIFSITTTGSVGTEEYDSRNPVFDTTREDDTYGIGVNAFWHRPFGMLPEGMSLVGTLAWYQSDSNIEFYDSKVNYAGLSVLYRF